MLSAIHHFTDLLVARLTVLSKKMSPSLTAQLQRLHHHVYLGCLETLCYIVIMNTLFVQLLMMEMASQLRSCLSNDNVRTPKQKVISLLSVQHGCEHVRQSSRLRNHLVPPPAQSRQYNRVTSLSTATAHTVH